MHKHFTDIKVEKLPDSQAVITGSITSEYLKECRKEAIESLAKSVNISGFRAGHIPEDVLVKKVGEMSILEESAEIALGREFANIVAEAKLSPIGRPEISIVKLAPGIALEFKAKVYIEPDFELPDYKKIRDEVMGEAEDLEVTDKEIDDVVAEIESRKIDAKLDEGETLRDKVKENLMHEKKHLSLEKKRLKLVDSLVKATEVSVPKLLVDAELDKMLGQFQDDVTRAGLTWDNYIKEVKKTESEIKEEWRDKAVERVKAELILIKIAEKEKIEPDAKEVEHEANHLLEHYPDADPLRARIYVYTQLRNHKVFQFLEGQEDKK